MNIKLWLKVLLVLWMLLMPTIYFLLVASPERGGMMAKMPTIIGDINKVLLPLFKRETGA